MDATLLYIITMSVSMTASNPPIPIWQTLSDPLPKAECEAAWAALPWHQKVYAKCLTEAELTRLSQPIRPPKPTPFLSE